MHKDKNRVMWRVLQVAISIGVAVLIIGALIFVTQGRDIPVLNPAGTIADQQRTLIYITLALGVFVVVPVFILLFSIAWRYREGNKKAKYDPGFEGHSGLEALWWGIPCLIILALSVITYVSTHALDPYKPLESEAKPVKVQVVSLEWRWLFIYPELGTATINYMNIPEKTPIELSLTSDAPMNAFWVPALAGQVYTMSGMTTKLHFSADTIGTYEGMTTNISGEGYSKMRFKVNSKSSSDFEAWAKESAKSANVLNQATYANIAEKSHDTDQRTYTLADPQLFDAIINKYMGHGETKGSEMKMSEMTN